MAENNTNMSRQVTDKSFYQYLKCPSWLYFDIHHDEERPHDPLMKKLQDDGLIEEMAREIVSDRPDLVEVTAEDPEQAFEQTLAFMREGRETIYGGALLDKHWVGYPDVLERVEGRSNFGDYYYVAADIKRSREVRDDYKFQGCFYAELLERVQKTKPVQGYIITPDKNVLAYMIEEFESEYKLTLDAIEQIVAGKRPAHFLTSGCKQSPWFLDCKNESHACDDLSLLNRVWREEVSRLEQAGIEKISDLALKSIEELEGIVPDLNPFRLELLRDQAIAIQEGRHIIRQKIDFPEAQVELFFDIESDPLRDFDYLFGVLEVSEEGEEYHEFFAETSEQEAEMWQKFVTFIEGHIDSPIYHYGWFEEEVVHRFGAKYGISEIAKEALERNMIDLLAILRPAVIFPLSFYSLKDLASYAGFSWRSKDASGANSVLWFEEWLKTGDSALRKKIVEYNEDDVIATYKLQRWLRENAQL